MSRKRGPVSQALAERVRALRTARGWTQADIARFTGISRSTLSRIEWARVAPTPEELSALASVLYVPPSVLLGETAEGGRLRLPGRRPNGTSTVYLGADGLWHGRVSMGKRPDGQPDRRHVCGRNEATVRGKVAALEAARDNGGMNHAASPDTPGVLATRPRQAPLHIDVLPTWPVQ